MNQELAGEGAFIVSCQDDSVLTIRELTESRRTVKERLMRAHAMESTDPGEIPLMPLRRVFQEELTIPEGERIVYQGVLCDVLINHGILVRMYLFTTVRTFPARIGSAVGEIDSPAWIPIAEILEADPGSNKFRPGVRETAWSYRLYSQNPDEFKPVEFPLAVDTPIVQGRSQA